MSSHRPERMDLQDRLWLDIHRALLDDRPDELRRILRLPEHERLVDDGARAEALWLSCKSDRRECATLLLQEFRADPNFSFDDDRESPLMLALLEDRTQIAKILLDGRLAASPNTVDKQGRTALVAAAWKDQVEIVQKLIVEKNADVNKVDDRGRNALHHYCEDRKRAHRSQTQASSEDVQILELLLDARVTVNKREDFAQRTALHLAVECNNYHAVQVLTERGADVHADAYDDETALHIAAANGHVDISTLLINKNAKVDCRKGTGWTPLHCAAECKRDPVEIVKALIAAGADVNATSDAQITALHTAAEAGNIGVVTCLLDQPRIDVGMRDALGNTAMLYAAKRGHKGIVRKLVECNYAALSEDALNASKTFFATITDFALDPTKPNIRERQFRPIFSLLSGEYPILPETPDSDRHLRWIHLPANSVGWCQELLIQTLKKGVSNESFEALLQSFEHEHVGTKVHAHYMRPDCHLIPVAATTARRRNSPPPTPSSGHRDRDASQHSHHREQSDATNETTSGASRPSIDNRTLSAPVLSPLLTEQFDDARRPSIHSVHQKPDSEQTATSMNDSMYLFMPYLHYEWTDPLKRMHQEVKKAYKPKPVDRSGSAGQTAMKRNLTPPIGPQRDLTSTRGNNDLLSPDLRLIHSHINENGCSLHIRRTLDQFFYRAIDTSFRDGDQVVLRHQASMCKRCNPPSKDGTSLQNTTHPQTAGHIKIERPSQCPHNARLIMVDQLWMWVVSPELIITSFPQRWKQSDQDPDRLLERISRHISSPTHATISDAYELALIVATQCTEALDMQATRSKGALFLDMFESSLGKVMDAETQLFRKFELASHEASRWLRNRSTLSGVKENQQLYGGATATGEDRARSREKTFQTDGAEPVFIHTMLDIREETLLLREIKDIRDELEMLQMIFTTQEKICQEAYESVVSVLKSLPGNLTQQEKLKKAWDEHNRRFNTPLGDIKRMQELAKRIYNSIKDLLDMKQKYANALQASDTARSGQTLMVFTIVTVVFLPLSFIAAFFAINIKSFPHDPKTSNVDMSLGFASQYIFGAGFAIAVPCVIVALTVKNIVLFSRKWYRRAQLKLARQGGPQHLISSLRQAGGPPIVPPPRATTSNSSGPATAGPTTAAPTTSGPTTSGTERSMVSPSALLRRCFGREREDDLELQATKLTANGIPNG